MKLFINVFQNIVNNCFIVVVVVVYLKMWGFPWQSMQITYLGSAKSLKNNTYSSKVLMNGFKFWNTVSVGCQIVLLKLCCFMKSMIYFEFAQKWTCSLSCRKNIKPLEVLNFFGWLRPRQFYNRPCKPPHQPLSHSVEQIFAPWFEEFSGLNLVPN